MANPGHHRSSRHQPDSRQHDTERWARDMTDQFRQRLSRSRLSSLSRKCSQRSASSPPSRNSSTRSARHRPSPLSLDQYQNPIAPPYTPSQDPFSPVPIDQPPSYASIQNLPLVPTPPSPTDQRSIRFRNMLISLSHTPLAWENPGLLDEALHQIPLDRIQAEADEESQILRAEAESLGKKPAWGYQDCVVKAMMHWFRGTWFSWVNNPPCDHCGGPTVAAGRTAATDDEKARGATRVELYQCSAEAGGCGSFARFPRYSDAFVLMQTRRGRVGEWVNCFSMLCRAINARVRWVWNSEDHVWTEVYSAHAKRWVHVDVCEGVWDKPRVYCEGWKRKIGYCIAFSADNAVDVTRRYCRNPARYGADRSRTPEACLLHILREIKAMRRQNMSKEDRFRLEGEDIREQKELQNYVILAIAHDICRMDVEDLMLGGDGVGGRKGHARTDPDAQKAEEARQRGDTEVVRLRRGGGRGAHHHDSRDQHQR